MRALKLGGTFCHTHDDVTNQRPGRMADQHMVGLAMRLYDQRFASEAALKGMREKLAKKDKELYPDIITAGTPQRPYYTNSTHLPVDFTPDVFTALVHQDSLQTLYTGGTVLHCFLGERVVDWELTAKLVKSIAFKFRLPYFTITPTFSICPEHGYIAGEHHACPTEIPNQEVTP